MDIMEAHHLLTMLELLDAGWRMDEYVVKSDDTIIVMLYKPMQGKYGDYKEISFERRAE